jgi:hypothetical protein
MLCLVAGKAQQENELLKEMSSLFHELINFVIMLSYNKAYN